MKVNKICISLGILVLLCVDAVANNVKIVGDVRVVPTEINGTIAPIEFTVTWDNSWRDQFNYDAVYLFLKYKVNNGSNTWQHVLLTGDVVLPDGFGATMVSSRNNTDKSEGVLLYRNAIGDGDCSVNVKLHWDIASNSLTSAPFVDGQVFLSAMAIEMVYVPQGAFRVGDPVSVNSFRNKILGIPEKYDVLKEDATINVKDNVVNDENPPRFALNRINDVTNGISNAWLGTAEAEQYFQIDMGKLTEVKYISIESMPGYAPQTWELFGYTALTGDAGTPLLSGTDKDWSTSLVRTYPTSRRLKLKNTGKYRYYRLKIGALGEKGTVAIKNIAMATEDLDAITDNSVLISSPTVVMDTNNGYITNCIYSPDGDINAGEIQENYPTGYDGFYAMKYEVSQEQYVAFLNKLTLAQQASRTIGSSLTSLQEGQYVFGDNHTDPQNRNGIILASRSSSTAPVVFANNLVKDVNYSQDGDGQTLACNYLTPADLRAYADWSGLRPLTELEYEKMSRRPFPEIPLRGEYAWNSVKCTVPSAIDDLKDGGKKSEYVSSGNVNAGDVLGGPVRVGAFAKNAASQEASGISFWGLADLSGNLAEIYYNLDTEGRRFCGKLPEQHGNGELEDYGNSDINDNVWPLHHDAFAWRGGSFKTSVDNVKELATADRSHNKGNYQNMQINVRYPDITFRLGCSKPVATAGSVLTLQNGMTTDAENAADTICSGSDYVIRGDVPVGINGAYSIAWFFSGNGGKTWDLIEGEYGRDLRLSKLLNINAADGYFKEYQYKRHIFGYNQNIDAFSGIAKIRIVNFNINLVPDSSFVDVYNTSKQIHLTSKLPLNAYWSYLDGTPDTLMYQVTQGRNFVHNLRYSDFNIGNVPPSEGVKPLVISWEFYGKYCAAFDTVWVKVAGQPEEATSPQSVVCGQSFRDNRGSSPQLYHTVQIGAACWMAENLNYKEGGGKCYDDNQNNCEEYGRLYSWTEAQTVCPEGWHLPNNNEWGQLLTDLGARDMKAATNEWKFKGGAEDMGLNTKGFNALPAGGYFAHNYAAYPTEGGVDSRTAGFYDQAEDGVNGLRAWWWTSTHNTHDYVKSPAAGDVDLPYYVMLDFENNFKQNSGTVNSWVSSIFCGSTKNPFNTTAVSTISNNVKNQFYMSVRCVKD